MDINTVNLLSNLNSNTKILDQETINNLSSLTTSSEVSAIVEGYIGDVQTLIQEIM